MSYGIYNNATDFYNNLQINNKVKYNINSDSTVVGTVVSLSALGVKAIVIVADDKKKYIIFPKNASMLEIHE
tara:strand:+ start:309 stop:524 length:216 start_codon:yes stop_codon:yes gene_type:complete